MLFLLLFNVRIDVFFTGFIVVYGASKESLKSISIPLLISPLTSLRFGLGSEAEEGGRQRKLGRIVNARLCSPSLNTARNWETLIRRWDSFEFRESREARRRVCKGGIFFLFLWDNGRKFLRLRRWERQLNNGTTRKTLRYLRYDYSDWRMEPGWKLVTSLDRSGIFII